MRDPRDPNVRGRERVELSLDGRQIAGIVVGALVLLGVVFVLGLNVGRQAARRDAEAVRAPDGLDALDRAAPPAAPRAETFTYHDKLTTERPVAPPPAAPAAVPAAASAAPAPAAPAATASAPPGERPPEPAAPQRPAAERAPPPAPAPAATASAFTIQLGAAQDRAEAERLAGRYRTYRPRIEAGEVGGKRWYRVRVGAFATKAEAERYLKDLVRETGAKGFVAPGR